MPRGSFRCLRIEVLVAPALVLARARRRRTARARRGRRGGSGSRRRRSRSTGVRSMPPPNHHTSSLGCARGACATNIRTFMCTVGTYGLRGCSTSDTPIASHARPAISGPRRGRRRRQPLAGDVREIDAAALEHVAVLDHARDAAAALGPRPLVAAERLPVDRLERGDDARLQADGSSRAGARVDVHGCRPECAAGALRARERAMADVARGTACRRTGSRRPPRTRRAAPASPNRRAR